RFADGSTVCRWAGEPVLRGGLVSGPDIDMTVRMMAAFGVEGGPPEKGRWWIAPARYRAADFAVEPDASAASYFFAAAAITGGEVTVRGLSRDSLQGDVNFVKLLAQMGCEVHWGESS